MNAPTDETTRLLRAVVKLLSLQLISGEGPRSDRERNQRDKIKLLGTAGLGAGEIADILGTTSNTVSVALSQIRKQAGAKVKSKKKGGAKKSATPILQLGHEEPSSGGEV